MQRRSNGLTQGHTKNCTLCAPYKSTYIPGFSQGNEIFVLHATLVAHSILSGGCPDQLIEGSISSVSECMPHGLPFFFYAVFCLLLIWSLKHHSLRQLQSINSEQEGIATDWLSQYYFLFICLFVCLFIIYLFKDSVAMASLPLTMQANLVLSSWQSSLAFRVPDLYATPSLIHQDLMPGCYNDHFKAL